MLVSLASWPLSLWSDWRPSWIQTWPRNMNGARQLKVSALKYIVMALRLPFTISPALPSVFFLLLRPWKSFLFPVQTCPRPLSRPFLDQYNPMHCTFNCTSRAELGGFCVKPWWRERTRWEPERRAASFSPQLLPKHCPSILSSFFCLFAWDCGTADGLMGNL